MEIFEKITVRYAINYSHVTPEEVKDILNSYKNNPYTDIHITEDMDCDYDGYQEPNGYYNIQISSGRTNINPSENTNYSEVLPKLLISAKEELTRILEKEEDNEKQN